MSILTEFLKILLGLAPGLFEKVKDALEEMASRGHFSQERKVQLIREIRPTREKEIDSRIDAEVAERFPEKRDDEEEEA